MQAIHTLFHASPARRTGLITMVVVAAALAAGAALLESTERASGATSAVPQGAAPPAPPVGSAGEPAVAGDPSVPSASSVFKGPGSEVEAPPVTF